MRFTRRRITPVNLDTCPLARQDIETLATYNGERARGIVHTVEWSARMARWQQEYDDWSDSQARAAGYHVVRPGVRKTSPDM